MVRRRQRGIKGAGSVYQRKSDKRWTGSFKLEGMARRKYVYAPVDNNTERAAYDLLQKAMREQEQGLATGKDQKLGDYLQDWFENVHKGKVYVTSYITQRRIVYKHLIPALGHVQLRKLTPQQVQKFMTDKGNDGLSAAYIRSMHALLHGALDNAAKWKLVQENVCDQASPPSSKKRKSQILTKEQILRLVDAANANAMGPFIKLALMSGMRHGEMLSLRWSDIDFQTNVLEIKRNVAHPRVKGYGFIEGDPKTDDGIRKIILPQFVADALQVHREGQEAQRECAGETWQDKDLVFCTHTGGYIDSGNNLRRFRRVLREAGLPEAMCKTMRVHDLRHNVATFLINVLKYPPTMVQALLGHSDIAITLGMYVETDPETLRAMMDDLNALFGSKREQGQADALRYKVATFLQSAFSYPSNFVEVLLSGDPAAFKRLVNNLALLFGANEAL
jgi:integrase